MGDKGEVPSHLHLPVKFNTRLLRPFFKLLDLSM
jgi:hypothetical protein